MDSSRGLADEGARIGIRMLQHINQALGSVDPQLVMSHVREAMEDGEELGDIIDEMMERTSEGTVVAERADAAGKHLRQALTEGGEALTASEDFIKNHVSAMRDHANEVMTNLNLAALPTMR